MTAFETNLLYCWHLDVYGCCSISFEFCYNYWTCVSGSREPKFGIFNKMSQLCCQYYPVHIEDLTSTKEAVIAKIHPVTTILNLWPNNSFNPGTYRGIRRHCILLPQNPGPLLILLLLEMTFVDNVV